MKLTKFQLIRTNREVLLLATIQYSKCTVIAQDFYVNSISRFSPKTAIFPKLYFWIQLTFAPFAHYQGFWILIFYTFYAYLEHDACMVCPSPTLVRSMGAFDKELRWEIGWSTVCACVILLAGHFLLWISASSIIFEQVQRWPKNENFNISKG